MPKVGCVVSAPYVGATIWTLFATCMRREGLQRELDLRLRFTSTSTEQLAELDRLLHDGVDALVMKPMEVNTPGWSEFFRRAEAAAVPIVTLDSYIDDAAVVCTVATDNAFAQATVAKLVFERIGRRGRVAFLGADPRLPSGKTRNSGFHDALREYPGICVVHEAMLDWVAPTARREHGAALMREALARVGDIDAVVAGSDEAALGALDVIEQTPLAGRVVVAGFDALPEALVAIRRGRLLATIRQKPEDIARESLNAAIAAAAGKAVRRVVRVDADLIVQDNVMEAALESLSLVPGLVLELSENHNAQRALQQSIIEKQGRIVRTVVAVDSIASGIRDAHQMMHEFVTALCADFNMTRATATIAREGEASWQVSAAGSPRSVLGSFVSSSLTLPIAASTRAIGSLVLESDRPDAFEQQERRILEAITHLVASALENAYLYAETLRLAETATQASRAKSVFLANMSHELRTPLNAVLGYAQILQHDRSLSERQRAGLMTIERSGAHLLTIINDILDLAQVEAGKLELYPEKMRLPDFLRAVADIIRIKAQEKKLSLEFAPADDLPLAVRADEKRLRQVLLNLLSNAVKFTARGKVRLQVRQLARLGERARLCFEVGDTGEGIAADQLDTIFLPFEQAGKVKQRTEGTGLGLAISRQLVRLMGGDIHVESELGVGSRFWFDIDVPVVDAGQATTTEPQRPNRYEGPRRRVLVVDDIAANRATAVAMLELVGFQTFEAVNGESAIAMAQTHRPDLIVTDVLMPVLNGLEAIDRLRRLPGFEQLPIIAVSASASGADEARCLAAGADVFLPKPIELNQLLHHVGQLLSLNWVIEASN